VCVGRQAARRSPSGADGLDLATQHSLVCNQNLAPARVAEQSGLLG
jgi:hypothetical protein